MVNNRGLKAAVLAVVSGVALNALLYLAMNTGLGYDIVVFGCIGIVEVVLIYNFLKWMLGPFTHTARAEEKDRPANVDFLDRAYEKLDEVNATLKEYAEEEEDEE